MTRYNFFILLLFYTLQAQAQLSSKSTSLGMAAEVAQDSQKVYLRWAPLTPKAWKSYNESGYRLVRYTLSRDGQFLGIPEKKILYDVLKPAPEEDWASSAQTNHYAAIMAQALYGDRFEVEMGKEGILRSVMNKAEEEDQRFAFALLSADLSFPLACLAGVGYTDSAIHTNERYFYQISSLSQPERFLPDSIGVLIDFSLHNNLPEILNIQATVQGTQVSLKWNENPYREMYIGYQVERSNDKGKTYQVLNKQLLSSLEYDEKKPFNYIHYPDSLPQSNKEYLYRIRGKTLFGTFSMESAPVLVLSKPDFPYQPPHISASYTDDQGFLTLEWQMEANAYPLIKQVCLKGAPSIKGPYRSLAVTQHAKAGKIRHKIPQDGTSYWLLDFVTQAGDTFSTLPVLLQAEDTLPPAAPRLLGSSIDTNGIVLLSWANNTETDFMGYKVFRSMRNGEAFFCLTDRFYSDTVYTDTLNLQLKNPVVYYILRAYDSHYNPSKFSDTILLEKPLRIPPDKPLFSQPSFTDQGPRLHWLRGNEKKGIKQSLYRKKEGEKQWILIEQFSDTVQSYTDLSAESRTAYWYRLELENTYHQCSSSDSLYVQAGAVQNQNLDRFTFQVDREKQAVALFWVHKLNAVDHFILYRAAGDEELSFYQKIPAEQTAVYDQKVELNTTYKYAIHALMKDGSYSRTKTLMISY